MRVLLALVCFLNGMLCRSQADQPTRMTSEFFDVLRSGDPVALKFALQKGIFVEARDELGNTPLMLASIYGDARCIAALLEKGADANATNVAGATALMRAAFDEQKVKLLLDHGADINAQSAFGNTALILAARPALSHRVVRMLVDRGAKVNHTNIGGATALISASAGGDISSVRLLLGAGALVNAAPLQDLNGLLLGGGRSALMWAAFRGDNKMVSELLTAGANVNAEASLGSPLSQAAWANQEQVINLLLKRGAAVNQANHFERYTALHWAASSDRSSPEIVARLLSAGANPNLEGGDNIDALLIPQTPLMLARHRGETPILASLRSAGATNETLQTVKEFPGPARSLTEAENSGAALDAVNLATGRLEKTAIESRAAFLRHASKQNCVSCHQQYLPLAALAGARKYGAKVNRAVESELIAMIAPGENREPELDGQTLFHPAPAHGHGYFLFAYAQENIAATKTTDGYVHHLAVIQARDGRWMNNLPRPPIQSGDVDATALAIHALQKYPLPGRRMEFAERVDKARKWLWRAKAETNEERVYQLLGLHWAGEDPRKLKSLSNALFAKQRSDGGWAQLDSLKSDAYATGQTIYALRTSMKLRGSQPQIEKGLRYLIREQRKDGTWYVKRRAFPFQPTMDSGFPYGRDSWISAAGTSWAVLALSQ